MKKRLLKAIAITLSAATIMGVATGCGGSTTSSSPEANASTQATSAGNSDITEKDGFFYSKTPVTFTMLFSDNSAYPYKENWSFFKTLQEKTNVKLNLTVVPMSDYNNKRSVLISSGQEPEIIPKTYPGSEDQFVTSGQILPVSDYVSQMPNYSKSVKDWKLEDDLKTITQADGKYYVLPELHESYIQDYSIAMRTDILKKNNIKVPTTWDELESVLKQLKKLYPNITPFSDRWQLGATLQLAGPAFVKTATGLKGTDADWSPATPLRYNPDKNNFDFYPTTNEYKTELTYFHKLIAEGLLDKESATQSSDQAKNKFATGKSFAISCNSQELKVCKTMMDASLGKGKYEATKINVLAGPAGKNISGNRLENGILITKKAKEDKNFSTLLKFVDWLWYSYKGEEFCKWGVEGETFTKTGDSYKLKDNLTLPNYGLNPNAKNAKDFRKDLGYGGGVFVLSYGGPNALAYSYMTKEDIKFAENSSASNTLLPNAPKIGYDDDTHESQTMLESTLKDYMNQMSYKFILGQANIDTDWNTYVKTFQNKGSTKYTQAANDAYAKQTKK
jgi:putative aldouronate transport system substrate-binding protein